MALPLPTVPATVYVAGVSEIKSADLNDYQTFMDAVKAVMETDYYQRSSLTDRTPVFGATDRNGRIRSYLGPEGYTMGPAIERLYEAEEDQTITGAADTYLRCGLQAHTEADADLDIGVGLGDNFPAFTLIARNANTNSDCSIHRRMVHPEIDDVVIVAEWRMNLDAIGSNGVDVWAGIKGSPSGNIPAATTRQCGFRKLSSDTNWQLTAADGATETVTGSGVPPVADIYQTFRIEYHGANSPLGVDNATSPVVRYFIDGTFEGEEAGANVPKTSDGSMGLVLGMEGDGTGPTADVKLEIAPIRYAYNEVLDGDIPA